MAVPRVCQLWLLFGNKVIFGLCVRGVSWECDAVAYFSWCIKYLKGVFVLKASYFFLLVQKKVAKEKHKNVAPFYHLSRCICFNNNRNEKKLRAWVNFGCLTLAIVR